MEQEIKEALESAGLSEKEIKVYISLLELGDSAVKRITERSKLLRVTVYPVLKTLIEKGFVSKYSMNKKSYFKALDPKNILEKIKEKEDKIIIALPLLNKLNKTIEEDTAIELFKGKEGISSMLEKLYSGEDKELWAYGKGDLIEKTIRYQSLSARKLRINKKIKLNILTSPIKQDYFKEKKYGELTKIKFNEKLKNMEIYIIFGKKNSGVINLKKEISGILIKNQEIADYHKFVFDSLK